MKCCNREQSTPFCAYCGRRLDALFDCGNTHNGKMTRSQAEAIYDLYPRKVGKAAAVKAITSAYARLRASGDPDPVTTLSYKAAAYAASPAGRKPPDGGNDYRPHPATWFNQARYEDDENEWQKPNGVDATAGATNISRLRAPAGKYDHIDGRA